MVETNLVLQIESMSARHIFNFLMPAKWEDWSTSACLYSVNVFSFEFWSFAFLSL